MVIYGGIGGCPKDVVTRLYGFDLTKRPGKFGEVQIRRNLSFTQLCKLQGYGSIYIVIMNSSYKLYGH